MSRLLIVLLSIMILYSCTTLIGSRISPFVNEYCRLNSIDRATFRASVNRNIYPNKIEITCEED